jgi:hypothetical protein
MAIDWGVNSGGSVVRRVEISLGQLGINDPSFFPKKVFASISTRRFIFARDFTDRFLQNLDSLV